MRNKKRFIFIPLFIVVIGFVFGLGFYVGQTTRPAVEEVKGLYNKTLGQPQEADFGLFWDVWLAVQEKYVDRDELNAQEMVYGAIGGLMRSLDDPYSIFMKPIESKQFLDDIGGSFEGIGAEIGLRKGILTIIAPLEGAPAQSAGLKAGDQIFKVNETFTADLTLDEAVNLIRGEKGTEVVLLVNRDGWEKAKEIKIIRDTIKIPIIKLEEITLDKAGSDQPDKNDIAHIQFFHFTENSPQEFRKIIRQVLKSESRGLVLDLRNNPGGYLEAAVDIASWFISKGEVVAIEDFGNGDKKEHRSKGYDGLGNLPVVILLNQGSASASEILAGALRDHLGIKIIGEKSFGKGSVQELEKLKGGSSLKITVAKWLTPKGVSIQEKGIEPDIEVKMTEEDIEQERDLQLDKAIEVLR